jgi:hypothetical protein
MTAVALVCLTSGMWWPPASASVHHTSAARTTTDPPLVKSGRIALGNCSAATVTLRVLIARTSFSSTQPVNVLAVARNEGEVACTYGGSGHGNQIIGPCGSFSLNVVDATGTSIWPGPVAYSCPMMTSTHLVPGARVTAFGIWPKRIVSRASSVPAPNGTYKLVIANTVTFRINLHDAAVGLTIPGNFPTGRSAIRRVDQITERRSRISELQLLRMKSSIPATDGR